MPSAVSSTRSTGRTSRGFDMVIERRASRVGLVPVGHRAPSIVIDASGNVVMGCCHRPSLIPCRRYVQHALISFARMDLVWAGRGLCCEGVELMKYSAYRYPPSMYMMLQVAPGREGRSARARRRAPQQRGALPPHAAGGGAAAPAPAASILHLLGALRLRQGTPASRFRSFMPFIDFLRR